jgi:hypothetical protein
LGQAFSDDVSDPAEIDALRAQARELDPEYTFQIEQAVAKRAQAGSDQAGFESLISEFSPEDQEAARRIKAGLDPRAVGSSQVTIAESGKTGDVASSVAEIEAAKEAAKIKAKAEARSKAAPLIAQTEASIQAAIQQEKADAKSKGETVSQLRASKAALPSLKKVVGNLKALAPIATSTYSGKAFDILAKETGFGATKGAEARAKFIAIIDNQVLPLLKQTFGAAFTQSEGEALKRTMGDPDASPEAKIAQLDAFIDNKIREIEVKEAELGQKPKQSFTSKLGITFTVE